MTKRLLESLGMLMIGDGVLTMLDPERHCLLWEVGPKPVRDLLDEFAQHPRMTRVAGLIETAAGVYLSSLQEPGFGKRLMHL